MGILIAIDYGTKKTGIAKTDSMKIIASPLDTVPTENIIPYLREIHFKEKIETLVVGKPKRLNNQDSTPEVKIKKLLEEIAKQLPDVKVVRYDERFTSKIAFRSMIDAGLSKKQRQNKELIDKISAAIILQDYMTYENK